MSKKDKELKIKKPSWWDEFKEFAIKGNAMALAVGTIIGGAFSTITKSLTDDFIMPIVAIFMGGIDFTEMNRQHQETLNALDAAGNAIENGAEAVAPQTGERG